MKMTKQTHQSEQAVVPLSVDGKSCSAWNRPFSTLAPIPLSSPSMRRLVQRCFLTPEEARSFLEAVRGDRLAALYSVALAIGLRPGEALDLRWQDEDLGTGVLRVQVALQRIEGKLVLVQQARDSAHEEPKITRSS
jgi:integrase